MVMHSLRMSSKSRGDTFAGFFRAGFGRTYFSAPVQFQLSRAGFAVPSDARVANANLLRAIEMSVSWCIFLAQQFGGLRVDLVAFMRRAVRFGRANPGFQTRPAPCARPRRKSRRAAARPLASVHGYVASSVSCCRRNEAKSCSSAASATLLSVSAAVAASRCCRRFSRPAVCAETFACAACSAISSSSTASPGHSAFPCLRVPARRGFGLRKPPSQFFGLTGGRNFAAH